MTSVGHASRSASAVKPIAVLVDNEGISDALLRMPFLRAVRHAWPDRPVWWIASRETAMARELAPWAGNLIARTIEHAGLTGPARYLISRLRALPPFDLVFDARPRLTAVFGARLLLSYRGFYAYLPYRVLSTRRPEGALSAEGGMAARMLSLVEGASGQPADWHGELEPGSAATHLATWRLPDGPTYVGLTAGLDETTRNWPLASFIALAERLERAGHRPVFLIGPQQRDLQEVLHASVPSALFPQADPIGGDIAPRPLDLVMAVGRRLAAAVVHDSDAAHLLGSVGTPLVSLFGPTNADRRPHTERGTVMRAQDFGGTKMEAIPVAPVLAAVEALIGDNAPRAQPPRAQ
jgi:ADP-heptose:LPS heptosyltransferase